MNNPLFIQGFAGCSFLQAKQVSQSMKMTSLCWLFLSSSETSYSDDGPRRNPQTDHTGTENKPGSGMSECVCLSPLFLSQRTYSSCGSLVDVIKQVKTILEPYLAVLCKQALQGLDSLHNTRHVIHRNIKPSNLLVNHKEEVKITDFGMSATLARTIRQRDTFVGTYNYMSPERISSDIWSLGMVILECAIGRFPYLKSEDQQSMPGFYELLAAIVESSPPSVLSGVLFVCFCLHPEGPDEKGIDFGCFESPIHQEVTLTWEFWLVPWSLL